MQAAGATLSSAAMQESFEDALRALVPAAESPASEYPAAFRKIAELLLNGTVWTLGERPHRLTEVEFYFNGRQHKDTFTHGDEMQREFARWYFHRTGGEYRGGTYKGLDLAFGAEDACAGILLRGCAPLEGDAELIDGPSLCVDNILKLTGKASVEALATSWDRSVAPPAPVSLTLAPEPRTKPVYATPRVGLTFKRGVSESRIKYLAAPYRFLTEPARIKKGRLHLVLALHREGRPAAAIAQLTGSGVAQIKRYAEQYEAGKAHKPEEYRQDLGTDETCQAFGACEKFTDFGA